MAQHIANPLIIYLERNRIYLQGSNLQSLVTVDIPFEQVADLEVLKPSFFEDMIKARLIEQKILPTQAALILSQDVYFEKDIAVPSTGTNGHASVTQEFVNNVPFERLATATFTFEKTTRFIATNQDILASIQRAFESAGFMLTAIVPAFLLTQFGIDLKTGYDTQKAAGILKNFESLKAYSLFPHQEVAPAIASEPNPSNQTKKGGKRVIILVGIFIVLIGVLILVAFQSGMIGSSGLYNRFFAYSP